MTSPLDPEAVRQAILAHLNDPSPALPPGATGALVSVVNGQHVEIGVATKVDQWTVELTGRYEWKGGDRAVDVTVRRTW